jgi:hypothetical protein
MRRLDDFVPAHHPLPRIRLMVNEALAEMDELSLRMYGADIKGGGAAPRDLTLPRQERTRLPRSSS